MTYESQLAFGQQQQVKNEDAGKRSSNDWRVINETNSSAYSRRQLTTGFFKKNSHDLIEDFHIQDPDRLIARCVIFKKISSGGVWGQQ